MKILIITYFKETNPGTFLQAYGVQYAYRQIFPNAEIVYLDYDRYIKEVGQTSPGQVIPTMNLLQKINHVLALKKRQSVFRKEQRKLFVKSSRTYSLFPEKKELDQFIDYANEFDFVSVGSDTIIESMMIDSKMGLMWLPDTIKAKKILFAASADTASNFAKHESYYGLLKKYINSYTQIGLRDAVTRNFFIDKLDIDTSNVLVHPDPTFYLPLDLFVFPEEKKRKIPQDKKVVFYHMDRRFVYRKELAQILKTEGYYLITSEYDPNCDFSFKVLTPFEWAALFGHCDYVITERFHDTVFSMRYGTPVLTCEWYSGILENGVSSKRESIARDFDNSENYIRVTRLNDLNIIVDKLKSIDLESFKEKAKNKVARMQMIANRRLSSIKISEQ